MPTLEVVNASYARREKKWGEFLSSLTHDQKSALFTEEMSGEGMELALHDLYVSGAWSLVRIKLLIDVEIGSRDRRA